VINEWQQWAADEEWAMMSGPSQGATMGSLQQENRNGGQNRGAGTGGLKKQQMRAELAVKEQGKRWHCSPSNKKRGEP